MKCKCGKCSSIIEASGIKESIVTCNGCGSRNVIKEVSADYVQGRYKAMLDNIEDARVKIKDLERVISYICKDYERVESSEASKAFNKQMLYPITDVRVALSKFEDEASMKANPNYRAPLAKLPTSFPGIRTQSDVLDDFKK